MRRRLSSQSGPAPVGDGPMAMLAELDAAALPREAPASGLRFADVLARVLKREGRTP